jgi:hypothetical protein
VIADAVEGCLRVGQGQEIVEIADVVRRPRQVLGYERRLIACDKTAEARQTRGWPRRLTWC